MVTRLTCYNSFKEAYPTNWRAILQKHNNMLLASEGSLTIATQCQTFNKSFKSMHNLVSDQNPLTAIDYNLIPRAHRQMPTLSNSGSSQRLSWPAMPLIKITHSLRFT